MKYSEKFWNNQKNSEIFRRILKYSEEFWNIEEIQKNFEKSEKFGKIWKKFEKILKHWEKFKKIQKNSKKKKIDTIWHDLSEFFQKYYENDNNKKAIFRRLRYAGAAVKMWCFEIHVDVA